MESTARTQILAHEKTAQIIKRMAWQLYENHSQYNELIICGIQNRGTTLAKLLKAELERISPIRILYGEVQIDKEYPAEKPTILTLKEAEYKDKAVVLVDDVLNSGKTLLYALRPFLTVSASKLSIAVLVDRSHKRYPIHCDVVGLSLSTSLQEHVTVDLSDHNFAVYLD